MKFMNKYYTLFSLLLSSSTAVHAQIKGQRIISTYLSASYSQTLYARTFQNMPWGVGTGLQTFLNTHSKFKPTIEVTGDVYIANDKINYLAPDGKSLESIDHVVNIFAGSSYALSRDVYVSFLSGPSFINGHTLLGIKPSLGFYFSENKRWTATISYLNIFHRKASGNTDFGSLSFSIGRKLF